MKKFFYGLLFCCPILNLFAEEDAVLRWAADAESGVPNVFFSPENPNKITGFEYDIAEVIAQRLGKQLQFFPNDWEMLVPGLQRKQYDILLNAIEYNTWQMLTNKADVVLSIPYYVTHLQLVVMKNNSYMQYFSDCEGKKIGILKQSWHAEKALKRFDSTQIVIYDDEVKAYADLKNKRLDGVLLDYPESYYYAAVDKDVRLVEEPISRLEYAVMVRASDTALLKAINEIIEQAKKDGTFRKILENWGLWNAETAAYYHTDLKSKTPATALDHYLTSVQASQNQPHHFYLTCISVFSKAAWMTLKLSLMAMALALLMGFPLAVLRTYGAGWVRWLVAVYVECVRGTPLLIQLLLIFYGLPTLAPHLTEPFAHWVCLSPFVAGVLALAINYSAYESEIYRAGLLAVPTGQMEAARALGMSHIQALWYVIFPQAIRTVIPPVTNDFIMLLQDSSLVSMITIVELTRTYQCLAATHFNYFETGLIVAAFYLLLGFPFIRLARAFEKKFTYKIRRN